MDIRANMAEQLQISARIIALEDSDDDDTWCADLPALAVRLAELVQAADGWRKVGGFEPHPHSY